MLVYLTVFSFGQEITFSAASNYPGTGGGSFAAGVLDTGGSDAISEAVTKFPLVISVGVPFQGPVGSTILAYLQESNDGVNWFTSDLSDVNANTLTQLQQPGYILLKGPIPIVGIGVVPGQVTGKLGRYLRCYYQVSGGPFTAGTLNAWLDTY